MKHAAPRRRVLAAVTLLSACGFGLSLSAAAPATAGTNALPPVNTLVNFPAASVGAGEYSALLEASDGNFYGVSARGGYQDNGFVYRVERTTGRVTHLHDFKFSDGATPRGTLVQGADGDLYGTTEAGGANRSDYCYGGQFFGKGACGVAYKVSLKGAFTKLHDFYSAADGYQAAAGTGVVQASDGNFYGMALIEFPTSTNSVFRLAPDGAVTVFYAFPTDQSQGYLTHTGLIQGRDGNLYGTTTGDSGTATANGTVFQLSLTGAFRTLHVFQGAPQNGSGDGAEPWGNLIQGRDGALYGTTYGGGTTTGYCVVAGCGTVYRVTTAGQESVLYRFTGHARDGETPENAGLAQAADGTLYGVNGGNPFGTIGLPLCYVGSTTTAGCGTLFRITTGGRFEQVYNFGSGNGSNGLFPKSSLIRATDGNLYGVALSGGGFGSGTVYRLQLNPATPVVEISGVSPAGGPPGTAVAVSGKGFTGATQVTFPTGAATPIPFTVVSDTEIDLTVPPNGVSGAIGVTTPRGTTFSPQLFYLEPTISGLVPTSAPVGGSVTVQGRHFDDLTSITVGGAPVGRFTYVTGADTAIDFVIPAGAVTGPIVISNPGGSAVSPVFTVTGAPGPRAPESSGPPAAPSARAESGPSAPGLRAPLPDIPVLLR